MHITSHHHCCSCPIAHTEPQKLLHSTASPVLLSLVVPLATNPSELLIRANEVVFEEEGCVTAGAFELTPQPLPLPLPFVTRIGWNSASRPCLQGSPSSGMK